MRIETKYIAENGRVFDNETECREYEEKILTYIEMAREIKDMCNKHEYCEDTCPFYNNGGCKLNHNDDFPHTWDI